MGARAFTLLLLVIVAVDASIADDDARRMANLVDRLVRNDRVAIEARPRPQVCRERQAHGRLSNDHMDG